MFCKAPLEGVSIAVISLADVFAYFLFTAFIYPRLLKCNINVVHLNLLHIFTQFFLEMMAMKPTILCYAVWMRHHGFLVYIVHSSMNKVLFFSSTELEKLSKSELESVMMNDPTHKVCQQELKQLKEEFERYKVKTQALHKNKSFKELTLQLEKLERLKTDNVELERQLQELKDVSSEKDRDQGKVITNLRDQLKSMEESYRQEKEKSSTVYKQKLEELERQVLSQRERTLALVAEKDSEIEMLQQRSPTITPSSLQTGKTTVPAFTYQRKFVEVTASCQAPSETSEADAAVHQLLTKPSGVRLHH